MTNCRWVQPTGFTDEYAMNDVKDIELFPTGKVVMTKQVQQIIEPRDVIAAVLRHVCGDWGDVCDDDRRANEDALQRGLRLFSVYHSSDGTKFWIITEADRSCTTVLLPKEY